MRFVVRYQIRGDNTPRSRIARTGEGFLSSAGARRAADQLLAEYGDQIDRLFITPALSMEPLITLVEPPQPAPAPVVPPRTRRAFSAFLALGQ